MPILPSGLSLGITRDVLIEHSENWFSCPDGHFWYWTPSPEAGSPPFDLSLSVETIPQHAPVPTSREEVKAFIRVVEINENDGSPTRVLASWRGEYLSSFPLYTELEEDDLEAWRAWVDELKQHQFLDDTLAECRRMAEICRGVSRYAMVEGAGEPDENGFIEGNLKLDDDP
jgi:hypothetical protein